MEELKKEPKVETSVEEVMPVEGDASQQGETEDLSSLDLLWHHAFNELDEWVAHAEFRDEAFLKNAAYYVESIKRNQDNLGEITHRFAQQFADWEKTARDEFLMSTTSLQHFFPLRSYEEINVQIDNIQARTLGLLNTPCQTIANLQLMDKYMLAIEQYIILRKKGRQQYLKIIKQAGNLVYENQKNFMNLFSKQLKSLLFPFSKYMEKPEELSKS